ncbi:MAG TPA: hypothetical protein PKO09_07510 [Anaerolineae bacterium]|nr:hypothetical protein [Anaerolineae bacterium]
MSAKPDGQCRRTGLFTVEGAAYILLALLAVGLRWTQLGLQPLGQGEAAQALAAYRFLHGEQAVPEGTVPLLFTANAAGFTLAGASTAAARWLPALAGLALALLPYGLRGRLGHGGALVASLLLAISPSAVYQSRLLDGAVVVAACGLAIVVGLVHLTGTQRPGGLYLAAGTLGLGLCAGAGTWTLLLVLLLFGLVPAAAGAASSGAQHRFGWPALRGAISLLQREKRWAGRAATIFLAVLGLVATAYALRPENAGLVANLLGAWAQGFAPEASGRSFAYPLWLLLRYEPLVLVLGLAGAADVLHRREALRPGFPLEALAIFWALAAAVLAIAGRRTPGDVLLVVVPLALLGGRALERAWKWARQRVRWADAFLVAGALVALSVFVYLQLSAYSLTGAETVSVVGRALPASTGYLLLALLALVLVVGVAASASALRGPEVLAAGGCLALLLVLGWWGLRSAWGLSHLHSGDPRELMVGQTVAPDVQKLVAQVEMLSLNKTGDPHALAPAVDEDLGPAIEWALRDFKQGPLHAAIEPPLVALTESQEQDGGPGFEGASYQGAVFPYQVSWRPHGLSGQALVSWLLYGAGSQPVRDRSITLWVRTGE